MHKGITIKDLDAQLVRELFTNDTNFVVNSLDRSLQMLWQKIEIFSLASRSIVSQGKLIFLRLRMDKLPSLRIRDAGTLSKEVSFDCWDHLWVLVS